MTDSTEILTRTEGAARLKFWESHPPDGGLVYLIQGERRAPVKVGHATNVRRRLRELQTGNHAELHVLDVIPGSQVDERALHVHLAPHRVLGEWCEWNGAIEQWLALRALAEQMMTFYKATGKVARLEVFDSWHTILELAKPKIPQSLPGEKLDFIPTTRERARRTRITPSAFYENR